MAKCVDLNQMVLADARLDHIDEEGGEGVVGACPVQTYHVMLVLVVMVVVQWEGTLGASSQQQSDMVQRLQRQHCKYPALVDTCKNLPAPFQF